MRIACPHCNKTFGRQPKITGQIDKAERYAEQYGSSFSTFLCPHCKKKFKLYIERYVRVENIIKAEDYVQLSYT